MNLKITNEPLAELSVEDSPLQWGLHLSDHEDGIKGEKRANEDELARVTKLLNDEHDLEVKALNCTYHVQPAQAETGKPIKDYRGEFQLRATLRQTCVVTLERIDTDLLEEFSQAFSSARRPVSNGPRHNELDDPFSDEPALKIVKGQIEIGPLVYQHLSMSIDPNPRKTGATFGETAKEDGEVDDKPPSPFVVLKDYKHQK